MNGQQICDHLARWERELRRRRPDLSDEGRRWAALGEVEAVHLRDLERGLSGSQAERTTYWRERYRAGAA